MIPYAEREVLRAALFAVRRNDLLTLESSFYKIFLILPYHAFRRLKPTKSLKNHTRASREISLLAEISCSVSISCFLDKTSWLAA